MHRVAFSIIAVLLPFSAMAQETSVSRRDGFLTIWESILRPAEPIYETPYTDVQEGDPGFLEITYAKGRGLLDDTEQFFPDAPLLMEDALLWLFRTDNVADIDEMNREDLPGLLEQYPIAHAEGDLSVPVTMKELRALIDHLDRLRDEEIHEISFYAEFFQGAGTAFGEKFDMHAMTAAHRTFPHNTLIKVTNVNNGKSVIVRINDRGPYVHGRSLDLSLASFEEIAERSQGKTNATIERLGDIALVGEAVGVLPEPDAEEVMEEEVPSEASQEVESVASEPEKPLSNLDPCTGRLRRYQRRITRDVRFHRGVPHSLTVGEAFTLGSNRPFVVQRVTFPRGSSSRLQDWVHEDERFSFTPSVEGIYRFWVGTVDGRRREMVMNVRACATES